MIEMPVVEIVAGVLILINSLYLLEQPYHKMINFSGNRIRKFVDNDQFLKYSRYAIGEIIFYRMNEYSYKLNQL